MLYIELHLLVHTAMNGTRTLFTGRTLFLPHYVGNMDQLWCLWSLTLHMK
jgi:hypothetical protein